MATFSWASNLFQSSTVTRASFLTNVRSRVDEDTEDYISDLQLIEFLRSGLWDINFRAKLLPQYATLNLDGSTNYPLPTDMTELYELVFISTSAPNNYRVVLPYNHEEIEGRGVFSEQTIEYYIRNGQRIEIYGGASESGTLRAYGCRIPTFPATSNDFIALPEIYLELLYMWMEWRFFARRRVPDEETVKRDLYLLRCDQVRSQIMEQYSRGLRLYG